MVDILISGGPVMIPLGVVSLVALAIIIERLWVLRRKNYLRDETVSTLQHYLVSRQYKAATDYCMMNPGPFTHLVAALVANRFAPYDELKEILEDTGRRELMGLQRGLGALATIVGGAPLLGLLGTVLGMIQIFGVVATSGSGLAEGLAAGIAQALITTAAGLIIAIPALFVHSFLEARAVGILSEVEAKIVEFLHLVRQRDEARAGAEAAS
ncbi:MAG TPA: MotA/TolQ/ExbB proton channel family protein [Thermoanaerobaculales bacterium]|nr:MotA/TolQ/ExbB proton channel family protein [Thermoanaerobaculales bacterium]HRZ10194.1 MotA/TolQ/ExbB proton channel family protein [Gemmatimonadales bacterium]HPA82896.1 MotA/TolQ/ExbB proton channel family protein [Thermoanaerobaculales bacterium]HQL31252.1 MotA/TolQ/ExbB proton channel family protein [Thermoanaerobaculales bacterium]HQN94727.1 MotA/TolQ/ExbB proton channel family protein [Thermoanaerobaculales bacterium]